MNQVSKFYNFFLTWSETKARCIFEGFYYCHLWKVQYQLSSNFLAFFHQIFKLLQSNYSPFFLVIKLYELSFWFQRCLESYALIWIWDLVVLPFMESSSSDLCVISDISWSVNCSNLVRNLCITFGKCQDTQSLFILEVLECIWYWHR